MDGVYKEFHASNNQANKVATKILLRARKKIRFTRWSLLFFLTVKILRENRERKVKILKFVSTYSNIFMKRSFLVRVWFLNHFNIVVYHFFLKDKTILLKENKRNRKRTAKAASNVRKTWKSNSSTTNNNSN